MALIYLDYRAPKSHTHGFWELARSVLGLGCLGCGLDYAKQVIGGEK